ncbi:MAG: NADH-ubiquinone oxidoreductase-F iron-sulfur binding region domain-containing protein [Flavobacteriaceae bacterium]|nr:NADH-ubiquinone oxidoreductase-F iron-sulfur binding region domain-containing protein [Flavobacteriaceae bacterium]
MANKNVRSLAARKELHENLFEKISDLSLKNASENEFHELAKHFLMDDSVVYGTASFYDFLKPENRAKKVFVCSGTACFVAGTQENLHHQLEKHFEGDEIGHAACVGRCHENSAFMYDGKVYASPSIEQISSIINNKSYQPNQYAVGCNTTPILTRAINDVPVFYQLLHQYRNKSTEVIEELKTSNLRGRGGAGFPFYFKVEAVSKEDNTQKYVVCNADEGDPGAYSDMYLLEHQTHKVLFGMMMTGIAVGADTGVLYIRGEYPDAIRKTQEAIQELTDLNLLNGFCFKIIRGQGAYVCGEETALLNSIEGLRPEVRVRPPYPAQYGLFGKPTVLSNVETFANVHWILENGGKTYANLGTQKSAGTKLVSLDSYFNQPGIYEIAMGTPLETIFNDFGKGLKTDIKAWQIGGPLGGIVPKEKIKELSLDFESLNENGFLLGHASFVSIPKNFPMISFIEHLLKFTADESCGKCYPCRIGSYRGYELVKKAQEESYKIDSQLFADLLETLEIGSLCALGGGIPLPLKNALQYFNDELTPYFKN